VCIRSFRLESVAAFVRAVIDGDSDRASQIHGSLEHDPIVITRTLDRARAWLRVQARGSERYGLVASSNALRLRPVGIFIKSQIDIAVWVLNPKEAVRSSLALEEVASEFEVQGLELDWVGVCWDANLRYSTNQWTLHRFSGPKWNQVQNSDRQMYLHNSYRVLLTRARQGMVILVPYGSDDDQTRKVDYCEGTFKFLKSCGIAEI